MKAQRATGLSPHRAPVNEEALVGHVVLGEPLALLASALLRLQLGSTRNGMTDVTATWTSDEGAAFTRAMERVEEPIPHDGRSVGQRDCDRFLAVTKHVARAVEKVHTTKGRPV